MGSWLGRRRKSWKANNVDPDLAEQRLRIHQGGCDVCGGSSDDLVVDHDHRYDRGGYVDAKPRGILCRKCNSGLGMFDDSPEKLVTAAAYLISNGTTHEIGVPDEIVRRSAERVRARIAYRGRLFANLLGPDGRFVNLGAVDPKAHPIDSTLLGTFLAEQSIAGKALDRWLENEADGNHSYWRPGHAPDSSAS